MSDGRDIDINSEITALTDAQMTQEQISARLKQVNKWANMAD